MRPSSSSSVIASARISASVRSRKFFAMRDASGKYYAGISMDVTLGPAYSPAREVAGRVHTHLAHQLKLAREQGEPELAALVDQSAIETVIDAAFWASLRREEGFSPRIS